MEELLFRWLLNEDMNKLFKFYWKKEPMLILQIRLFCWLFLFLFDWVFFFFSIFFSIEGWSNSSFACYCKWIWPNCSNFIGKRKSRCWFSWSSYFCWLAFFFFFTFSFFYFFNVKDGRTPLYVAALCGHEQIVQILLEKGKATVDFGDQVITFFFLFLFLIFLIFFYVKEGESPLHAAAQNGHEQTIQILLEKGKANVDHQDQVYLLIVSFSFSFSFFSFSVFYFFYFF